ncbi:MAG: glucose-1-phosphate adenylyltransferase [Mobilicoccus sp.]|nr:glucose-1-phosphate adenylyltransferase [Mobilicoccus sp.]
MRRQTRNPKVLAIVLAGGEGKRLMPLTADRAKPAVPFGGIYRLIDFALSNVVNSGYLKVVVLTQYKSHSLDRHVTRTWRMSNLLGNYVAPIPAQQRMGKQWYMGSADAIYQSLNTIDDEKPDIVVVVGADHVYRMDFSQMVEQHIETGAGITVAAIRQPIELADQFGVIEVDESDVRRIGAWREKPTDAKGLPDSPGEVLASMGNYVFDADVLRDVVTADAENENSKHDMGGDIVPAFVERGEGYVYDFNNNEIPGATPRDKAYWRDVGTIDSYYEANMDLIAIHPVFNMYNYDWPIYTTDLGNPPAKFVHNETGRLGEAINSAVSPGVVISGARVEGSVVSPRVRVNSYAHVNDSVLLDGVRIGRKAVVEKAILDKNVVLEDGAEVGVDHDLDRERGFHVSPGGVVVVPKGTVVTASEARAAEAAAAGESATTDSADSAEPATPAT